MPFGDERRFYCAHLPKLLLNALTSSVDDLRWRTIR